MATISEIKCNKCKFQMGCSSGDIYVTDDYGERVRCTHPGEGWDIERVLGLKKGYRYTPKIQKLVASRTGFITEFVCLDCLKEFEIDVEKDDSCCPRCKSKNTKAKLELDGQKCPRCKKGKITKEDKFDT